MNSLRSAFLFAVVLLSSSLGRGATVPAAAPAPEARAAVLGVVQKFFDAMAARDQAACRATLLMDGQLYAVSDDPAKGLVVSRRTHAEFVDRMTTGKERLQERIWDPTVQVGDRLATVWAPYDFHRDGKFSHSGIDIFTLVRTDDGWKIAGLVFTMDPNTPSKHPAGPPAPGR